MILVVGKKTTADKKTGTTNCCLPQLLPAIQVQTLNGLMETISLAVNDLTREHSRRCEGR